MSVVKELDVKANGQPQVDNPTKAAYDALISGKDPNEAVYGTSDSESDLATDNDPILSESSPLEELELNLSESDEEATEDTVNNINSTESEESGELSENLLDAVTESDPASPVSDIEEITVRGPDGRKQKIKIDYSDKDAIKKLAAKAAGMRKFQKERDDARKALEEATKGQAEEKELFSKLEKAWENEGVQGVVTLLGNSPEAWQKAVDAEIAQREYLASLSPEEKYKHDLEMERKAAAAEKTELEKRYESLLQQNKDVEEAAQTRALESKFHPAFDRYRFAGKLGDAVAEQQFDEAVWTQAVKRLSEYPDNIELTQALVDKEFRTVSNSFRKLIKGQTEQKVKKTIAKKKEEAAQRVQTVAKKGIQKSTATRDFVDKMKRGDIQGSFLDVFTGKVKF